MKLDLTTENILKYAKRYDQLAQSRVGKEVEENLRKWFQTHQYLDKERFLTLCLWKSSRPKKLYTDEINNNERIKTVTSFVFTIKDEYLRISVLQLLKGISWPVASVLLHFAFPDQYMIMDFRAIWSLGWEQPKHYTYDFWIKYTQTVKEISTRCKVDLRTLDKALWYFSKENQSVGL